MPLKRDFDRYRAVICGSTWLMVGLSWPLWVDGDDFPRVPLVPSFPDGPTWISWIILAGLVVTLSLATLGRIWRGMVGLSLIFVLVELIRDQNRWQPWIYQFLIIGLGLICCSRSRALGLARWYTIGLYAYSGLSKLDVSFCRGLGPTFLSAGFAPLGLSTDHWPESVRNLAVLALPGFEVLVALLLAFGRTRRVGLVGSLLIHASLVVILGPWSLGHSAIVLVWNVAQGLENLCLFLPNDPEPGLEPSPKAEPLALVVFGIVMILPVGERWGFCDAWPAHALYASHAERSDVYLHEDDVEGFPEAIRKRLGPADLGGWRRLDLTGWSRDLRGTPIYPSGRIGNAIAEYLSERYRGEQPIRLVQWGRAGVWDGKRDRDESIGLKAIQRRGDRFLLNAHPARTAQKMIGWKNEPVRN